MESKGVSSLPHTTAIPAGCASVLTGKDRKHLNQLKSTYFVNVYHLTGDSKNGLDVVLGKFLDQLTNRGVVLCEERGLH